MSTLRKETTLPVKLVLNFITLAILLHASFFITSPNAFAISHSTKYPVKLLARINPNSTDAIPNPIYCTARPTLYTRAGDAIYKNTVVCNGVYDHIQATVDVQLSTSGGGWQTVFYDNADCYNNNQCTASGSVSGQSGQYVQTLNGWGAIYNGKTKGDGGIIAGPYRIG